MQAIEKAVFYAKLATLARGQDPCGRIYFGQEFCQRLMPRAADVTRAVEIARERKAAFTLVTPFVTNAGMALVKEAIGYAVSCDAAGLEVVVNDWGVLNFMYREYPSIPLAAGRLLTKQKRGPQLLAIRNKIPATTMDHFQRSNIDVPHVRDFLAAMGIKRVELDNLLQGLKRPAECLPASLYHPYGYVTTTRLCLMADGANPSKNLRSICRCNRECQAYDVTMNHGDMPVPILLKGNTQFYANDTLPADLAALNITRLVLEPTIPI